MMKIYIFLAVLLFSLISCEDQISIKSNGQDHCLVVYCFPSPEDSVDINISTSQSIDGKIPELNNVRMVCRVNGKTVPYHFVKEEIPSSKIPIETYRLEEKVSQGDTVHIETSATGFSTVTATVSIPDNPEQPDFSLDTLFLKGDWYTQIRCLMKDPPGEDYYAIRVQGLEDDDDSLVIRTEAIETTGEPILNNYNTGNDGFNTSNDFYHNFYIFDDTGITDSQYTLHLNMPERDYIKSYKVQFFHISREFYKYMKSLNNINNNDFGNYGMSLIRPTYTNIQNGAGILGAYSMTESKWLK